MPSSPFSLRLPFTLSPTLVLSGEYPVKAQCGQTEISLSETPDGYALETHGCDGERDAESLAASLGGALLRQSVFHSTPVYRSDRGKVTLLAAPRPAPLGLKGMLDGYADDDTTIIYPSDRRLARFRGMPASISLSLPASTFLDRLVGEFLKPGTAGLLANDRLVTAIELFCDVYREGSQRSRFLTLTMVLEVLAEPEDKPPIVRALIERWDTEASSQMEALVTNGETSDNYKALDSLRRELLFRRDVSIRRRVRRLGELLDTSFAPPEGATYEELAILAYDVRGSLLHTGSVEDTSLAKAYTAADKTVRRALELAVSTQDRSAAA